MHDTRAFWLVWLAPRRSSPVAQIFRILTCIDSLNELRKSKCLSNECIRSGEFANFRSAIVVVCYSIFILWVLQTFLQNSCLDQPYLLFFVFVWRRRDTLRMVCMQNTQVFLLAPRFIFCANVYVKKLISFNVWANEICLQFQLQQMIRKAIE